MSTNHSPRGGDRKRLLALALLLSPWCASAASVADDGGDTSRDPTARVFELVLPSDHLLGDWGGVRSDLEGLGVTPRLILVTDLAGNASGGLSKGITAPTSVELSLLADLDTQRWGRSLSQDYIGNVFGTQQIHGSRPGA